MECRRTLFPAATAILSLFILAPAVFAQNGLSLETQARSYEAIAARQGTSAVERHNALVRLASIRQLSGDIEGAARAWLDAASAIPGQIDDDALLSCAYCLAAMGEWERARIALEPLLAKSARARFLYISIDAISTGSTAMLAAIADNTEYSQMKSEILFLLWRISPDSAAERWRQRLAAEFPQSPEGRLASGQTDSIAIKQSPFWLFLGGLDSLPLMERETAEHPSSQASTIPVTQTAVQGAAPVIASVSQPAAASGVRLQTGLFGKQANAQSQVNALRQAGFSPFLEQRTVNNSEMWAVTVPGGADANRTLAQLKNAGFEAFPLQ